MAVLPQAPRYREPVQPGFCGGKKRPNFESTEQALVHDSCVDPKKPRQSSGFHGVTAKGKRWAARIYYGGKKHYIGAFDTKQEAALAYDRAAREHGGGKRKLNYNSIEAAEEAAAEAEAEHTLVHGMGAEPKKHCQPSGFHGVTAHGKYWKARITYGDKRHYLGTFDTEQEAALAYDRAAREHDGGKKKLNYNSIEAAEEAATQAEAEHTLVHGMGAEPKKPRQSSGFHGVTAKGKRWAARIYYGGKKHYIGTFDTRQEAALAYDRAAREHGEGKKKLNFERIKAAEEAAAHAQAEMFADALCAGPYQQRPRCSPASSILKFEPHRPTPMLLFTAVLPMPLFTAVLPMPLFTAMPKWGALARNWDVRGGGFASSQGGVSR
jgi:hypothetical protein